MSFLNIDTNNTADENETVMEELYGVRLMLTSDGILTVAQRNEKGDLGKPIVLNKRMVAAINMLFDRTFLAEELEQEVMDELGVTCEHVEALAQADNGRIVCFP